MAILLSLLVGLGMFSAFSGMSGDGGSDDDSSGGITAQGTDDNDRVALTPGPDVFDALGGDDIVDGLASNDILRGGEGDDVLIGNDGNDRLSGQSGDDTSFGGEGDDTLLGDEGDDDLYGSNGEDGLFGGAGFDFLVGGYGADSLSGGTGDDFLLGGAQVDDLRGGNGDDILIGGDNGNEAAIGGDAPREWLYGGEGEDVLFGGAGSDELYGGNGDDILIGSDFAKVDVDAALAMLRGDPAFGPDDALRADLDAGVDTDPDALRGGSGNDLFFLGGDDFAVGGSGEDEFVIGVPWVDDENDVYIADFVPEDDVISVGYDARIGPPTITYSTQSAGGVKIFADDIKIADIAPGDGAAPLSIDDVRSNVIVYAMNRTS